MKSYSLPILVACLFLLRSSALSALDKPEKVEAPKETRQVTNSIGMKLSLVPAGVFVMGSPASEPGRRADEKQHAVEISKSYFIGVFEVTQRQYYEVMGENPLYSDKKLHAMTADFPAVCVSWDDAMAFCKMLSERAEERKHGRVYRLPTEAEWEYACRGGPGIRVQPYHFGATIDGRQANFNPRNDGNGLVARVGAFPPNALGLFDMHGNAWEWCLDLHADNYYETSPRKDPQGADKGSMYVLRGGSCNSPDTALRSASRYRNWSNTYGDAGFRVVFVPAVGK